MKLPRDVEQLLRKRFDNAHRDWLAGAGVDQRWPMTIALGVPTEQQALRDVDSVRAWVAAWGQWSGAGQLEWITRQWKVLGMQRVPATMTLNGADDVARWTGQHDRWTRATERFAVLVKLWPTLAGRMARLFGVLADYGDADFARLVDLLAWLYANPGSGLYVRQLPVAGLDSKWVEARKGVLSELVALLRDIPATGDFHQLCGLKKPAAQLRIRILDHAMRQTVGGLGDITAPVTELAAMALPAKTVFIVENLQTGLAFDDMPGAVVVMALGYSVDLLARVPWIEAARCIYWGDIDTHGFAILNRARCCLPNLESALMTEETLLKFKELWTDEKIPHGATELPLLRPDESHVYRLLKSNSLAQHLRLEQERIAWNHAWHILTGMIRQ